jgi:hypothetical protein
MKSSGDKKQTLDPGVTGQWTDIFRMLIGKTKQKCCVYRILYPIKISLGNEGRIKTSTNKSCINPRRQNYTIRSWTTGCEEAQVYSGVMEMFPRWSSHIPTGLSVPRTQSPGQPILHLGYFCT